mmetsp:Transcript_33737/g.101867  ORF Transcript_33737/g.101867 Transcript_33737/m.101867 type:complete len:340 (-) Transcript_33737:37-1056(-)
MGHGGQNLDGFMNSVYAGMATTLGVFFLVFLKCGEQAHKKVTAVALAFAAGVMLYISFTDAREGGQGNINKEVETGEGYSEKKREALGRLFVGLAFFGGILIALVLDRFCPDENCNDGCKSERKATVDRPEVENRENIELGEYTEEATNAPCKQQRTVALISPDTSTNDTEAMDKRTSAGPSMGRLGLVTFLAMTVHNFPEGVAVFCERASNKSTLTLAIALHNIPEGAAVAIPIYQATQNFWKAFFMTFASGLTQPIGAAVAWLIFWKFDLDLKDKPMLMGVIQAVTAGIMVCISLLELLPAALQSLSPLTVTIIATVGFAVMDTSIILMEWFEGGCC